MKKFMTYIILISLAVGCQNADSNQQGGKKNMKEIKAIVRTAALITTFSLCAAGPGRGGADQSSKAARRSPIFLPN